MFAMLFGLICNCCDYMKNITDNILDLEYYIIGEYGYKGLFVYNIIYAIILGITTFITIYIIIPSLSAIVVLCFASILVEAYQKLKNTYTLIKNVIYGITNDVIIFLDGMIVSFIFLYCFYPLLFN